MQELYAIKGTAHSLAALLLRQKEETEKLDCEMKEISDQFEQEMGDKKALWDKNQAEFEMSYVEKQENLETQRKREDEEYKL